LAKIGYVDEAVASYQPTIEKLAKEASKGNGLSRDEQWQLFSLLANGNGLRISDGGINEGLAAMRALAKDERIWSEYRTNVKVNLAAYLAENGDFAEALTTIEEAYAEWSGDQDWSNYKLGGSERHFSWIKGCALSGLGRVDDAKPYIDAVLSYPEKPYDAYADIYSTSSIEQRLYICLGDTDRYADMLLRYPNNLLYGSAASLVLQPALGSRKPRQNAFWAKLRENPKMKALADQYLILPDSVTPALNGWR
jgi:tetratricopeptide (TPR) repeat protein